MLNTQNLIKGSKMKKTKIVAISILLVLGLAGCKKGKELSNYEQGIENLKEEKFSEALSNFKAAETTEKDLRLVYRGEGMSYLGLGQYEDSLGAFKLALEQSNGLVKNIDYDINFYMAVAEYKSGRLEEAIDTYTSILAVNKNNADAYYLRGKVKLDMDRLDEAREDFDQAILIKKNDSQLYINIYSDLFERGYENEAKVYVNSALANVSRPSSYELGILNYYLGDYTQARNYFEESSETKKTEEGIIYLGKTYKALNDAAYAIALYEEYTTNNKTAAMVYNEMGLLKAENKDYEGALASFEAGINGGGDSCRQPLLYNRIVANEFLGNFSVAKTQMQEYISLYPDDKAAGRENIFLKTR